MEFAPIVLFVYNRPVHTLKTLEALQKNELSDKSSLYIFSDGAKESASQLDLDKIANVKSIIRSRYWCKDVHILEREKNMGLAENIIDGVTNIVNEYGSVIVLEDDLITSPYFLRFMNDALRVYREDKEVISIGANSFFARSKNLPETFFIPIPDCWGWATWKDRWDLFERDSHKLIQGIKAAKLVSAFNLEGVYDFWGILNAQASGEVSSWAIRWQAIAYLNNMMSLYPRISLTKNIGFGEGATHTTGNSSYAQETLFLANKPISVKWQKPKIKRTIYRQMRDGYRFYSNRTSNSFVKLKKYFKHFVPPILASIYKIISCSKCRSENRNILMWRGRYASWKEAMQFAEGYSKPQILEKVRESVLKVKSEEASYERDSVLFEKPQHPWPLISLLLQISLKHNNTLHVIDFGGSLGSTYFSNRIFFKDLKSLRWSVVEQEHFVNCGKKEFADERLHFFQSIEDALQGFQKVQILLLSSVLQYLPDPYLFLEKYFDYGFEYIIFDRTAFIEKSSDRLTLQYVPASIYEAVYPSWFFSKENFLQIFNKKKYSLELNFPSYADSPTFLEDGSQVFWEGFLFKKSSL